MVQLSQAAAQQAMLDSRSVSCKVKVTGAAAATGVKAEVSHPALVAVATSGLSVLTIDSSATGISVSDTNEVIGVLIHDMLGADESVKEIMHIGVTHMTTPTSGAAATTAVRALTDGITDNGSLWLQIACASGELSAGSVHEFGLHVDFLVQK